MSEIIDTYWFLDSVIDNRKVSDCIQSLVWIGIVSSALIKCYLIVFDLVELNWIVCNLIVYDLIVINVNIALFYPDYNK